MLVTTPRCPPVNCSLLWQQPNAPREPAVRPSARDQPQHKSVSGAARGLGGDISCVLSDILPPLQWDPVMRDQRRLQMCACQPPVPKSGKWHQSVSRWHLLSPPRTLLLEEQEICGLGPCPFTCAKSCTEKYFLWPVYRVSAFSCGLNYRKRSSETFKHTVAGSKTACKRDAVPFISLCCWALCGGRGSVSSLCITPSLSETDKPAQFTSSLRSATDKRHKSFFHVKQFPTTCSAATGLWFKPPLLLKEASEHPFPGLGDAVSGCMLHSS